MRILHWAFPYQPGRGGQAIFIERLAIESAERGHTVGIMVGSDVDLTEARRILGDKIEFLAIRIAVGDIRLQNAALLSRVSNIIEDFGPELIHVHNLESQEIVYLRFFQNTKGKNIPIVCTLHDLVSLNRLKSSIAGGKVHSSYAAIVSPSKYFASQFDSVLPDEGTEFKMIHHGVPPLVVNSKSVSPHPRIVFAADLHEHKGAIILMNAWQKLHRNYPNITLLIAGKVMQKIF